jgi:phage shock protein E
MNYKIKGENMSQVIIDVREPFEFSTGHVKGAINIPPTELMAGSKKLKKIPKDAEIILYCLSGSRSNASMHYLRQMGYENLTNGINKEHVQAKYLLN